MTPPTGAPMPGRRPEDPRRERPTSLRTPAQRQSVEATRRLLAERRGQVGRDGGSRGRAGGPRGGGRGGGPRRPRDPDREARFRRRRLIALAVAGAALVGLWLLFSLFQPFGGEGEEEVSVRIPSGAGIGEIGDLLEERGVVSSAGFFEMRARLRGDSEDLRAGNYTLRRDMSYAAALDALAAGPAPANVINVTVPEGRARSEVAPIVEDAGLEGDYEQATERSELLDPADYGAEDADSLEGFLYPSTYELKAGSSVDDLVRRQLEEFKKAFEGIDLSRSEGANLTPYEVLTIASMVEREAMIPEERPIVASVIYNRLDEGIPLGIDATTRFATGNWTEPLTQSELAIDSPYNTRENAGLPPGPIGSPGAESIEAAANPDDTDFLYYVVKPGTCGEHEFTETDAEFQAAVDRYNSERAARGGESPTDC
jgi:peptidoglycan lytic transglycosylase G